MEKQKASKSKTNDKESSLLKQKRKSSMEKSKKTVFVSEDEDSKKPKKVNQSNKDLGMNNDSDEIIIVRSDTQSAEDALLEASYPTISIALPSSIIDNAQSKELRSYLVGQLARTCSIFKVDEVVIFHDSLNKGTYKDKLNFCLTNLQYLETPQYLRKLLFPINEDLSLVGLMNPLDSDHHLRSNEFIKYREGVVLNRPAKDNKGSWVNIGLKKDCFLEQSLPERTRVTIKLDKECQDLHDQTELNIQNNCPKKYYTGKVVSSLEPKSKGYSWGFFVRVVDKFDELFNNSIFKNEKYDLVIGTSDKGKTHEKLDLSKDSKLISKLRKKKKIDKVKHCLIVFGGIQGLEGVVDDEESNKVNRENLQDLFDCYVNTCPNQGSRTIRTEEALMVTLSVLKDKLKKCNEVKEEE
eukprot:CAMPEP_0170514972 /NCGR_PEP_ID=MMETSP0209-20121228/1464_1 /TAXON_ID=665100 ORGANISM="Litonotus pictus, Strain P1" /NCGR_SAMPLE_ID=MMETSP0209 /ASSEMBLY_ACC=CAM_ASM_000301 /LENGTH=409 /DNA_ID=CAMNT_0010799253 /DNA_START=6 /DNA_END=1235 /DNA_ORIENTATION=-